MLRTLTGRIIRLHQHHHLNQQIAILQTTCRSISSTSNTWTAERMNPLPLVSRGDTAVDLLAPNYAKHINIISKAHNSSNNATNKTELSARDRIENLLKSNKKRVFVFMKGVPSQPACGYSNAVVQILDAYGVEYDSFDVLSDDSIRNEVKAYSNWPTIPQVYVGGSFVGGCDILIQMHQSNELESLFSGDAKNTDAPATDATKK